MHRRATDIMLVGKEKVVCGYGDVGKELLLPFRGADLLLQLPKSTHLFCHKLQWTVLKLKKT
jgi:hypothetical protein